MWTQRGGQVLKIDFQSALGIRLIIPVNYSYTSSEWGVFRATNVADSRVTFDLSPVCISESEDPVINVTLAQT